MLMFRSENFNSKGTKMNLTTPDTATIESWSIEYIANILNMPREKVVPNIDVDRLGLDSTTAVAYIMSLEEWLGIELMPELLFRYPTIGSLAKHVSSLLAG